jgi:23S rRNA pseudouridine1911/1915/1917 synthase
MKEYSFIVPEKLNNIKAKDFLSLSGISSEIIQKVKFGGVIVNNKTLTNINDRLFKNDIVKIVLPPDTINPYVEKVKGDLEILYEDEYFLAVFKKQGVLTHSSKNNKLISLEQLVLGYLDYPYSFRPINRLDRDTSGIVLIAKDSLSASFLNKQMKDGLIK